MQADHPRCQGPGIRRAFDRGSWRQRNAGCRCPL